VRKKRTGSALSDTGEGGIGPSNVIERDVLFHFISGEIYTGHILVGAAEVPRAVVQHRFKFQFQLERAGRNHACDSKKKQERGSTRSSARARCDKGGGFMLTQGGCRCAFGVQRCQVQGENIEQTLVVRGAGRAGHQIGNGMSPVISSPPRCVIRRRRRRRRRRRGRYEIIVLQIVFIVGVAEVGQVLVQVAQFKIFIHLPFLRVAHQHRHTFQRGRPVVDSCAATKEKTLRWKKEKKSSRKKTTHAHGKAFFYRACETWRWRRHVAHRSPCTNEK